MWRNSVSPMSTGEDFCLSLQFWCFRPTTLLNIHDPQFHFNILMSLFFSYYIAIDLIDVDSGHWIFMYSVISLSSISHNWLQVVKGVYQALFMVILSVKHRSYCSADSLQFNTQFNYIYPVCVGPDNTIATLDKFLFNDLPFFVVNNLFRSWIF